MIQKIKVTSFVLSSFFLSHFSYAMFDELYQQGHATAQPPQPANLVVRSLHTVDFRHSSSAAASASARDVRTEAFTLNGNTIEPWMTKIKVATGTPFHENLTSTYSYLVAMNAIGFEVSEETAKGLLQKVDRDETRLMAFYSASFDMGNGKFEKLSQKQFFSISEKFRKRVFPVLNKNNIFFLYSKKECSISESQLHSIGEKCSVNPDALEVIKEEEELRYTTLSSIWTSQASKGDAPPRSIKTFENYMANRVSGGKKRQRKREQIRNELAEITNGTYETWRSQEFKTSQK